MSRPSDQSQSTAPAPRTGTPTEPVAPTPAAPAALAALVRLLGLQAAREWMAARGEEGEPHNGKHV